VIKALDELVAATQEQERFDALPEEEVAASQEGKVLKRLEEANKKLDEEIARAIQELNK